MPLRLQLKRAYEPPDPSDGHRVLVDRIWPRGISKKDAEIDDWVKTVAPSTALRQWYGHDPERFEEFSRRYRDELASPDAQGGLDQLVATAKKRPLTLITATRDIDRSNAWVLLEILHERAFGERMRMPRRSGERRAPQSLAANRSRSKNRSNAKGR